MAERKAFLLRIDPAVLESLQKWADDELRSLNGQIEFVLRRILQQEGRLRDKKDLKSVTDSRPESADSGTHAPG